MSWDRHPRPWAGTGTRLFFFAMFCALTLMMPTIRKSSWLSIELIANVAAFVVAVLLEVFVMHRFRLEGSVLCPACRRDNAIGATTCVYCGMEWNKGDTRAFLPSVKQIPAARRTHRIAIALMVVWVAIFVPLPFVLGSVVFPQGPYFIAFFYIYELTVGVLLHRIARALREHRGSLCLHCAYPLDGTMTHCPECGKPGNTNDSRAAWSAAGIWVPDEATAKDMVASANGPRASASASI